MTDSNTVQNKQTIVPYLYYEDVEKALRWLSEAFGFREREKETMRSEEGRVVHAAMDVGDSAFMLGSPGKSYRNSKHMGQAGHNLYVYVDNLEEHYARTKRSGAKLLQELSDTFYGDKRYGVEDPEGHQWYFGQKVKEVAPEHWKPTKNDLKGHE
jgi:uncharacterized glyoxalase superfamily protein PhnB